MESTDEPRVPFATGGARGDHQVQGTDNLEGLQWGKSGQEMDQERKEQV